MPVVLELFPFWQGQSIVENAYDVIDSGDSSFPPEEAKDFEVAANAPPLMD